MNKDQASSFPDVLKIEHAEIEKARALRQAAPQDPSQFAALSFSGGGIRSATFNLGVLQALAEMKLLRKFDYLSTVSGGGYIGSWLAAWIKRDGIESVERALLPDRAEKAVDSTGAREEPSPIRFLRKYSNYLTPRMGFFSADTWAVIATYLRNLLLNQTILALATIAVILLPRIIAWGTARLARLFAAHPDVPLVVAFVLLGIGSFFVGKNMESFSSPPSGVFPRLAKQKFILGLVVLPLVLAAWMIAGWLWFSPIAVDGPIWLDQGLRWKTAPVRWAALIAVVYTLPWLLGWFVGPRHSSSAGDSSWKETAAQLLSAPLSGALGGILLWRLALVMQLWKKNLPAGYFHAVSWGLPLVLVIITLVAVLHIGLMGFRFQEEKREWWARLGGLLLTLGLGWSVLFAISFFGPLAVMWVGAKVHWSAFVTWVLSTIGGVLRGKSENSGKKESNKIAELLSQATPFVFILGLLLLVAIGVQMVCPSLNFWLLILFLISLGGALLLSWRVDINEFSMHLLYRNRLARCYLGASRKERRPNRFTGFDREDDTLLADFSNVQPYRDPKPYSGPYPIINTALNLVRAKDLAWQSRKATSLFFTPRFSGYDVPREWANPKLEGNGYRPTDHYGYFDGGPFIGTALAISGAAASPNMGYHSSAPLAFLMTVFNVRLGWWMGNPRHQRCWKIPSPRMGLSYLLNELLGNTSDERGYVYLSDGGHFENLGLYELVRRRCQLIVACDGSADSSMQFEDLANAIEKCRIDFGVEIDIDADPLRPPPGSRFSQRHWVVGTIHYEKAFPGEKPGKLVYLKASLAGDEPTDVRYYADKHPTFPHESTADQFFDEAQFESYRALGYQVARSAQFALP